MATIEGVKVSSCEADCLYAKDQKCTYEGDISINSDFECDFYECSDEEDEPDAA